MARGKTRPKGRPVNGLLLLDKPAGVTSNDALQQVKRLFNAAKAGHTGSLDPLATGLLPICFGEATKVSRYLLDADKVYRAEILLGVTTDTGDSEGTVLEQAPVDVGLARLEEVLEGFRGDFLQMPPMYSALKHNGQPLYKLARRGIEVERESRQVTVHDLDLEAFEGPVLKLKMRCSSGFYVRTLAHDIGTRLGCGGHVIALRRLAVGQLDIRDSVSLDTLRGCDDALDRDRYLRQCDSGLGHLPRIELSADGAFYLCRGQAVRAAAPAGLPDAGSDRDGTGAVRLYARGAGFLGIGELLDDGRVAPLRLFNRP